MDDKTTNERAALIREAHGHLQAAMRVLMAAARVSLVPDGERPDEAMTLLHFRAEIGKTGIDLTRSFG